MRTWKIVTAVSASALVAGGVAGVSGVAGAEPTTNAATTYVDGLGKVTDDFDDHFKELGGALSQQGDNSQGTDTVLMWQSILAAEGYLGVDDLDGYFGGETAKATQQWQADNGVDGDDPGTVGHQTWSIADDKLVNDDGRVYYEAIDGGGVLFVRAESPDDGYELVWVTTKDHVKRVNDSSSQHTEHFKLTIDMTTPEPE